MDGGTRYASERYARAWRKWWREGLEPEQDVMGVAAQHGEPTRYPIGECCDLLGIDRMTLKRWLDEAHIEPESDTIDRRYKYLSREQITLLARRHNRIVRLEEQAPGPRLSRREREHQARLEAVEEVVRQLAEQQSEILRELRSLGAATSTPAPVIAPTSPLPALPPAPRRRQGAGTSRNPLPPLPDGWRPFAEFAAELHVPQTSARRYAERGQWPAPHRGYWASGAAGTFPVTAAYDEQQQRQVRALVTGAETPGSSEDGEPGGEGGSEDAE